MELVKNAVVSLLNLFHMAQHKMERKIVKRLQSLHFRIKVALTLQILVLYGHYLVTSHEWSGDNVYRGYIHVIIALPALRFLFSFYFRLLYTFLEKFISKYGSIRACLYVIFVLLFSYGFVAVFLDKSALTGMHKAKELFMARFANNTMKIEEHREYFQRLVPHPLSANDRSPDGLVQIMRYPMEDVEMDCTTFIKGFPGGRPLVDQVEWRHNGIVIPVQNFTDRYSMVTHFKELSPHSLQSDDTMKEYGLTLYMLNSKLSIYLLDRSDFGSFTCHIRDTILLPARERKTDEQHQPNGFGSTKSYAEQERRKHHPGCQCTCLPERQYFFQDEISHKQEFRLIKMEEKHDQIEAPVSSILFFSTNYFHLSPDHDVFSDYTVNDVSVDGLCDDSSRFDIRGCSSLQRLLAQFMCDETQAWWFLNYLPVFSTKRTFGSGAHLLFGHCLCENAFGQHNMKYTRKYWNRTAGKYEMFEIEHPLTLLVRPLPRNSTDFFGSFWNHGSMKLLPLADYLPEYLYEPTYFKDLAMASVIILNLTDVVFIIVGLIALKTIGAFMFLVLNGVGVISRKCILEGSMGYLWTAMSTCRSVSGNTTKSVGSAENQRFDLFLCHSEAQTDQTIVYEVAENFLEKKLGLRVCLRDRDLPPNRLELGGLEQAIENSQRFIIFLSKDLLQDPFRQTETAMIFETLWDGGSKKNVLVVRLDHSQIPGHWTEFTVHDWTSGNLSQDDHRLKLTQWVHSYFPLAQARGLRSKLDALVTVLPFLLLCFVFTPAVF